MQTTHRTLAADARDMAALPDGSVDLVVTSPPYPMIEMWDDLFREDDPAVGDALDDGDGEAAFESMHAQLDAVWDEVARVLADGGIACVNVGDATRTLDEFRVYPNHARVTSALTARGLSPLPEIVWRKPTNSAAKFMGSGMLPPNAYVTLEHEYVLVFRKGEKREFEPMDDDRYASAYFWEERNEWFSDLWTDITGELQAVENADRERSAAFPFELPYRLVNMYSTRGDLVLDPFWGTGTTTTAAMCAARNSVGYELDASLVERFADTVSEIPERSRTVARERLAAHRAYVERTDDDLAYTAANYDLPVRTKRERDIQLYAVDDVADVADGYRASHTPV
ncbi:site-specific DNA-methyltransferase [Salarchaeum sp. JOR-1]|uniref:DNA-methyltransferase n=1 Tax=Salarchaeum sp. JOR-1 TaxID=2599399 RepID=UPI00119870FA|nr:site-specific DNA-methyltransferase [Salarchaeum sp. JOR-1]QDX41723.1 site-specific DNA-methyltransferase [Salarchaeum sp. JOR-1]